MWSAELWLVAAVLLCRSKIGFWHVACVISDVRRSLIFVDQAAQYRFSVDLPRAGVGCGGAGIEANVRDALADALVGRAVL